MPGHWAWAAGLRKALQRNWVCRQMLDLQGACWLGEGIGEGVPTGNWELSMVSVLTWAYLPSEVITLAWLISWMECSNDPAPHLEERGEGRTSSLMWELTSVFLSSRGSFPFGPVWGVLDISGLSSATWAVVFYPHVENHECQVCWNPREHGSPHHLIAGYSEVQREEWTCSHWPTESEEVRARSPGSRVSGFLCVPTLKYLHLTQALVWWALNLSSCSMLCFFLGGGWLVPVLSAWFCITCF